MANPPLALNNPFAVSTGALSRCPGVRLVLVRNLGDQSPAVDRVGVEAPEPQRFRIKQVEDIPGELLFVHERNECLTAYRVQGVDIESIQLLLGLVEAGLGSLGLAESI